MALLTLRSTAVWVMAAVVVTQPLQGSPLCEGMSYISAGGFQMGDSHGVGGRDERPVHTPKLIAFYIDRCEVSNASMCDALQWAFDNGHVRVETNGVFNVHGVSRELLDIDDWNSALAFSEGRFSVLAGREQHPCIEVTWFGALAFANFRSLREGRKPCIDFTDWSCAFSAPGIVCPRSRMGKSGARRACRQHYPWGGDGKEFWTHVDGSQANFWGSGDAFEKAEGYTLTTPVGYYDGSQRPVGAVMTNDFGLFDMIGNVEEWCWDVHDRAWYAQGAAQGVNPVHTGREGFRVVRGGSWITGQKEEWAKKSLKSQRYHLRAADRTQRDPGRGQHFRGFRCVRR